MSIAPEDETLLDKAIANYNAACTLRNNLSNDEMYLNIIGYHLQQAVELAIKYQLNECGVEYPRTHAIDQLISYAVRHNARITMTDYIDDHSEMFSQWEAMTRYIVGYRIELRRIDSAMAGVSEYLDAVASEEQKRDASIEEADNKNSGSSSQYGKETTL